MNENIATMIESQNRDEEILHRRFEHFFKTWAPKGDESLFHSDLMMLVRTIHSDAAKPYEQAMSKMMQSLPVLAFAPSNKP